MPTFEDARPAVNPIPGEPDRQSVRLREPDSQWARLREPDSQWARLSALVGSNPWFLAPVSPVTWRSAALMTALAVYTTATFIVVITMVAVSGGFLVIWLGIPFLVASLFVSTGLAQPVRSLVNAAYDLDIAAPIYRRAAPGASVHRRLFAVIADSSRWRAVAFHFGAFWLTVLGMAVFAAVFGASIAGVLTIVYRTRIDLSIGATLLCMAVGIVGVYLASWFAQAFGQALAALTSALLGPGRSEQLAQRVEDLTAQRSGVVEVADDERRRIERDLHDGAQQRLVALSVDLGISRREAEANPELALVALDRAHAEVQSSLAELRDLVRGVHPQILTDRGLDAALSALASRSPIPVDVEVVEPDAIAALPAAISAAAYFVVSECLTNTARHSGAGSAIVHVEIRDGALRITVRDDGVGDAKEPHGGGLSGLRRRVEALDGAWTLSSPAGAGTTVGVSLPCA